MMDFLKYVLQIPNVSIKEFFFEDIFSILGLFFGGYANFDGVIEVELEVVKTILMEYKTFALLRK
jgi:hypothetical protein